jgi:hypothetical protein
MFEFIGNIFFKFMLGEIYRTHRYRENGENRKSDL